MLLIEQKDIIAVGLEHHIAFQVEWEIGSPEAVAADYADVLAEGPFVFTVNDECAWAGQHEESLHRVAEKRLDPVNLARWKALADLYAGEMGLSRHGLVLRFASVRRALRKMDGWVIWERVYHWPDEEGLAWTSLLGTNHPEIETRETYDLRHVRYAR